MWERTNNWRCFRQLFLVSWEFHIQKIFVVINPSLHSIRVIKAELALVVLDRHLPTDILIITAHRFSNAVDIRAIRVDVSEFSLVCFGFGSPNYPLGFTLGIMVSSLCN